MNFDRKNNHKSNDPREINIKALITGGAYSGKSDFAPSLLDPSQPTTVLGTGILSDPLFTKRISQLKGMRPQNWGQIDVKSDLLEILELALKRGDQILVDSLNQWIATLVMQHCHNYTDEQLLNLVTHEVQMLWSLIASYPNSTVLVTSEVGAGLAPPKTLSRLFRMLVSKTNVMIARHCTVVIAMNTGFPMKIKGQWITYDSQPAVESDCSPTGGSSPLSFEDGLSKGSSAG